MAVHLLTGMGTSRTNEYHAKSLDGRTMRDLRTRMIRSTVVSSLVI